MIIRQVNLGHSVPALVVFLHLIQQRTAGDKRQRFLQHNTILVQYMLLLCTSVCHKSEFYQKSRPSSPNLGNNCPLARPLTMPKFLGDQSNNVPEKCYKFLYILQYLGALGGLPVPKFTNMGDDV